MTFNKPANMKYTDMAIYIDKHFPEILTPYENPEVESKIYEYIYHICYVLACKGKYFKKFEDYDPFALYAANECFLAFRNKYIHKGEVRKGKLITPTKSSLNFIKTVLYPLKVEYQKRFFTQVSAVDFDDKGQSEAVRNYMVDSVRGDYDYLIKEALNETVERIPELAKGIIKKTPYGGDPVVSNRLYKSCMLSILNSATLPEAKKERFAKTISADAQIQKAYAKERENCIIVWHLDSEKFKDYIQLLVKKIKAKVAAELEEDIHDNELSEDTLDDILDTAYSTYDMNQNAKE